MDVLHQHELDWIIALQEKVSMAKIMEWTSYLGWEAFIVLLPCVYLCFNRRLGGALFLYYYLSVFVNDLAKFLMHSPRPYWLSHQVHAFATAASYGLPSGHAQMAAAGWFVLALVLRKRLAWELAGALVLAVSLSRVYLGAHFISDVVLGWLLGAVMVGLFAWAQPQGEKWVRRRSFASHVALSVTAALAVAGVGLLAASLASQSPDPPAWSEFSKDARRLTWLAQTVGGLLGASSGVVLLDRCIGLDLRDSVPTRLFALAYGLGAFYLLDLAYNRLALGRPEWLQCLCAFLRFWVASWLIAFHAPWASFQMSRVKALVPHPHWLAHPSFVRLQSAYERLARCCSRWSNPLAKV